MILITTFITAELLIYVKISFKEIFSIVGQDGEKMLKYILTSIKKVDGNAKMQEIVSRTKFDLGKFLKDRDLARFFD